ncbi:5385_t:CDS:2 [Gigaspora margarita]|uniref:5385_t:CDS:1 n=1 Tax=Gigaspora margarita TaxID=4874 RepID=A0ABN7V970_GIGMA|nr:5385_t:CDS:2 [Gigaspora margarita]
MSQQSTFNTLKPVYNLVELGLDDYEENELVLNAIHDLYIFFQNSSNCTCRQTPKQRDLRTCFENPAYLKLCRVNDYLLSTLQNHLQSNGLTEHVHGNTGLQYGAIHGFPSPLWHQDDSGVFIYLPTGQTYVSVYNEYKKKRLWYEMIPNLRFQPHASDLCEVCSSFKAKLLVAKQDIDEYNKVQLWILKGQHYNNNIEEKNYQNEFPEGVSKGGNTTLNMVYHFLQNSKKKNKKLRVTCDNCSGQNKNNLSLWFWSWLCSLKLIKKVYRDSVNTIDYVENIVNNSSKGNDAIQYKNSKGLDIGMVHALKKSDGEEIFFLLLLNNNFDKNSQLNTISTVPLSDDRKNTSIQESVI